LLIELVAWGFVLAGFAEGSVLAAAEAGGGSITFNTFNGSRGHGPPLASGVAHSVPGRIWVRGRRPA
jgi:hypothetical protein